MTNLTKRSILFAVAGLLSLLVFNGCVTFVKPLPLTPEEEQAARQRVEEREELRRRIDEDPHYFYFKHIRDTTVNTEKAGTFVDPGNEITRMLSERTGRDWARSSGHISFFVAEKSPGLGAIGIYPRKKPKRADDGWYQIVISHGILIQAEDSRGLTAAKEHFMKLVEGTGEETRIPKGTFTAPVGKKGK